MCTLMIMEKATKKEVATLIAYTGDLSQFPELNICPITEKLQSKVLVRKKNTFKRHPKNDTSNDDRHAALYMEMMYGPCNEVVTYQGSARDEAVQKTVDTYPRTYIQRGHLYRAKLDPKEMPKGRRPLSDIHKDRRLRRNGSGKTKAVSI